MDVPHRSHEVVTRSALHMGDGGVCWEVNLESIFASSQGFEAVRYGNNTLKGGVIHKSTDERWKDVFRGWRREHRLYLVTEHSEGLV
jgi:hypothetical protein